MSGRQKLAVSDTNSTASATAEPSDMEKRDFSGATPTPENGSKVDVNNEAEKEIEASTRVVERSDPDVNKPISNDIANEEIDDAEYPKSWKLGLITIALCLSVFCMALDNTIIATAIPRITDRFHSLNDVGWYASAYLLTTCAFQLIFGKLYTFYSIKHIYLIALGLFELGSLICAVAPNSTALILGRAVAGLGSAGIFSGAILIVAHTVPLRQRPTYTGLIGGMYGIASVAGPLMGGAFTDNPHLTWRWCFFINLPLGGVTVLFILFFFTAPGKKRVATTLGWKGQLAQMDLRGTAAFLPGVVCLLLALSWGGTKYPWKDGRIIALLVLAVLLIITFLSLQLYQGEKATVPPRVFSNRNVWGSALYASCMGGAFFVMLFYIPIWFQAIKGATAVRSGVMNIPMVLGLVVVSILVGVTVTMMGYYTPFMYVSVVATAIGAGLLTTLKVDSGHDKWIGYQVFFGAGIGFGMQNTLIAVQTALPLADVPIGTAIIMFSQTLGGALMVSVGQNVFTNQLLHNIIASVPGINPSTVINVGATQIRNVVPQQFVAKVLVAYNKSLTETFYISVALSALAVFGAIPLQWLSVKGKKLGPAVPA